MTSEAELAWTEAVKNSSETEKKYQSESNAEKVESETTIAEKIVSNFNVKVRFSRLKKSLRKRSVSIL